MNQQPIFDLSPGESKPIHFLPCQISQGGPCPVDKFFIADPDPSLHGRTLKGQKLNVGFLMLAKEDGRLRLKAKSSEVHYWKYGGEADPSDQIPQILKFHELLKEVHSDI